MPTKHRVKTVKEKQPAPTIIDFEQVSDAIVHQVAEILGPLDGQKILICVGKGNTGAVGVMAAAKLIRDGARPTLLLAYPTDEMSEDGQIFLKQAGVLNIPVQLWSSQLPATTYTRQDLLIDALLGAGTEGSPRYPLADIITAMNDSRIPVLALDVPSGLDPKTGKPANPTVVAMVTLPITVPTENLLNKSGALYVGKVVSAHQSTVKTLDK